MLIRYQRENRAQFEAESDDFTLERYRQFGQYLPASACLVADVGCSTGRGGAPLLAARPGLSVVGIDVLPERLIALPDSYIGGLCCLASELPLPDGCVDVAVAGELVEHLAPHDVDTVLCELQRMLRVGGRLLVTTPNPGFLRNRLMGRSVLGGPHLTQQAPRVLRFRLRMHGFRHVRVRGSGRMTRLLGPWFPLRMVYGSYLIIADKR